MYEIYWRLDCKPFENTPDPRFLYYTTKHEEALMRLLYAVKEKKQGAVLTGEYGSGKTLLCRTLLQHLKDQDEYQVVLIVNPKIAKKELLREILFQMGEQAISAETGEVELLRFLEARLKQSQAQQKRTVFIIDEAQILTEQELEEIRLLLNFQDQASFLMTLLLIGQDELKKRIQKIEPLKQRLAFRYHLTPLDLTEVEGYIQHRLQIAGRREGLFSPGAIGLIYQGSKGIPRQVNNICDYALLIGFSQKAEKIGVEIIENCLQEMDIEWREEAETKGNGEDLKNGSDRRHLEAGESSTGGQGEDPGSCPEPRREGPFHDAKKS